MSSATSVTSAPSPPLAVGMIVFEGFDLRGDGGLSDAQLYRCGRDASQAGDRPKVMQSVVIDRAHADGLG
jgi:hypothetical protein